MTLEETRNILSLIRVNYHNSFKDYTKADSEALLKLWSDVFKNYPYKLVLQAVETIIVSDSSAFAPNVGQVMTTIKSLYTSDSTEEASDAFDQVRQFVREVGCDYVRDHYEELPELTRRVVSIDSIRAIGLSSPEQNDTYAKPRFIKAYTALKEARERELISTGHIDQLIAEHAQKALKQGNYKQIGG